MHKDVMYRHGSVFGFEELYKAASSIHVSLHVLEILDTQISLKIASSQCTSYLYPSKFLVKTKKIFDNIDFISRNMFPTNIVRAMIQQTSTSLQNITIEKDNETLYEIKRNVGYIDGTNYLGKILFLLFKCRYSISFVLLSSRLY